MNVEEDMLLNCIKWGCAKNMRLLYLVWVYCTWNRSLCIWT